MAANVSACIAVVDRKVFLARRAPGQKLEGYWEFPGGKQEVGETIQECLEREIREEFDMLAQAGDVFVESLYDYPGGQINLIGVYAVLPSTPPTLTVHDRAEWVPIGELMEFQLAPADIPIAREVIRHHL